MTISSASPLIDRYQDWAATKWNGEGIDCVTFDKRIAEQMLNAVVGMAGESGELMDIVKKLVFHRMEYTEEIDRKVKRELGDQLYYWVTLCRLFGFRASDVMAENEAKLNARYPTGFDAERSNNRSADDV